MPSPVAGSSSGATPTRQSTSANHNHNHTVALRWDESGSSQGAQSLQMAVAECVETKTVTTTTTTTTRTYPPLLGNRIMRSLDSKEYPLANEPIPEDLQSVALQLVDFESPSRTSMLSPTSGAKEESTPISPSQGVSARRRLRSASRTEASSSSHGLACAAAPTGLPSRKATRRSSRQALSSSVADRLLRSVASNSRHDNSRESNAPWPSTLHGLESRVVASSASRNTDPCNMDSSSDSALANLLSPSMATTPTQATAGVISNGNMAMANSSSMTMQANSIEMDEEDEAEDQDEHMVNSNQPSMRSLRLGSRPDLAVGPDASLPSPRLSPTLAAQMDTDSPVYDGDDVTLDISEAKRVVLDHDQEMLERQLELRRDPNTGLMPIHDFNPMAMVEAFDAMPTDLKTFMMYQFLRRCPRKTLRVVSHAVGPVLQCDFLRLLPLELSYQVLSYLDHVDLCQAAQVCKQWRQLIDSNEMGWKELFDRDGFKLAPGELKQAILQGWGWQDPVGPNSAECDLSRQRRLSAAESDLLIQSAAVGDEDSLGGMRDDVAGINTRSMRTSKRKRLSSMSNERLKRRVQIGDVLNESSSSPSPSYSYIAEASEAQSHKSEGPLAAADMAAAAVPNPKIGLASLSMLHLFKSLYRRHYQIRESWMSGKVKPRHIAFAAHPRHVITCLQFDDNKIITGSDDTEIHVYDTATGELQQKLQGHEGGVWALQYHGNTLVSGSTDRTVRVWNIEKGICTQVFYGHTSTVRCLQILMPSEVGRNVKGEPIMQPPKPLIITGSRDYQLRVWRLPEANSARYNQAAPSTEACPYFIRTLTGHTHSVRAIAAHGDTLVSGSYDNSVRVWKISTGEPRHILTGHNQKVYSVVLDHERNRCISGSMDSMVKIWDLTTGQCLFTLEGHSHLVGLLDLREGRLVSAAADSTLRIWNPEDGMCRTVLAAHTGAITCFQHDARKVISGSEKAVKMWDIQSGQCMRDLLTSLTAVWQVKFDARRCVAAVQRDALTYVEILDFGAVRDGAAPEELGERVVVNQELVNELMAQQE
ncbi:hypothetical protein TD95_003971 [Thielaviopsis punctulata]|uniref:F-box domain-containing protein n=1 Tax=Thielaviopsis punctulata TaxID=72032 RepID=A0A0F4ZJV5_9PEZI|nr:hypothetical protein TD95_002355 [Thielaviopsis punctulata]KKA30401.1 hypothetical protein TD95_003971 [Thielaviopsis punctulata]